MQAIVVSQFGGPEVLKYVTVNTPSLNANRVEATSVNFADIQTRLGKYHAAEQF
jgi:NADPH2:quinone reductase